MLVAGFLTGAATAVQVAFAVGMPTEKKAWAILAATIVGAGISRAAGAYLDWTKTTDSPNPPADPPA